MALPADFSKIFGSTATGGLTPIGDVNYAKGWEFVGSNPPTKNDFSYLQNLSDLKSQWLYSNKLQRANPFGDIKSDGAAAIAAALANLGLGEIAQAGVCLGVLGVNGYISIPLIIGGVKRNLLIQWGYADFGGSGSPTSGVWNNFTYAFPSESYQVVAIHYGYTPGSAGILSIYGNNRTGFYGFSSLATAQSTVNAGYIAIGI